VRGDHSRPPALLLARLGRPGYSRTSYPCAHELLHRRPEGAPSPNRKTSPSLEDSRGLAKAEVAPKELSVWRLVPYTHFPRRMIFIRRIGHQRGSGVETLRQMQEPRAACDAPTLAALTRPSNIVAPCDRSVALSLLGYAVTCIHLRLTLESTRKITRTYLKIV
jgi:hypothetical protein